MKLAVCAAMRLSECTTSSMTLRSVSILSRFEGDTGSPAASVTHAANKADKAHGKTPCLHIGLHRHGELFVR